MTFLPLVQREMRVAARRRSTFWSRAAAAAVMVLTWIILTAVAARNTPPATLGGLLFYTLGVLTFLYALATGVFLTSDCLSAEKRDGTLGLLFLTDLRGHDVVLGKLAGASLNAIYTMLGVLPLLALPLLLGGVTGWELVRMVVTLLSTLALSLCLGLWVSSRSESAGASLLLTVALLIGVTLLTLLAVVLLEMAGAVNDDHNPLLLLSPITSLVLVEENEFRRSFGGSGYFLSIGSLWFIALGALGLACLHLPRAWREKELGIKADAGNAPRDQGRAKEGFHPVPNNLARPEVQERWGTPPSQVQSEGAPGASASSPTFDLHTAKAGEDAGAPGPAASAGRGGRGGGRSDERAWRRLLLETDPYFWLAGRPQKARRMARLGFFVLAGLWCGLAAMMFLEYRDAREVGFGCCVIGLFVLTVVAKCMLAAEATRQFHEERAGGATELLLTTPLTEAAILAGQRRAVREFWRAPKLILVAMTLLLLWFAWGPLDSRGGWTEIREILTTVLAGGLMVLFLDEHALIEVGMAMGLRQRRHHQAVFATVARVLLPPWLGLLGFFFLGVIGSGGEAAFYRLLFLWFSLGAILSAALAARTAVRLPEWLRGDSPQARAVPPGTATPPLPAGASSS